MGFIDRLKNEVEIYNYDYLDNKSDLNFCLAADIEDALAYIATLTAALNTMHERIHFQDWAGADEAYHEWERGGKDGR